jgi:hypothetical protein
MLFSLLDRIYRIKFENHYEQIQKNEEGSSFGYYTNIQLERNYCLTYLQGNAGNTVSYCCCTGCVPQRECWQHSILLLLYRLCSSITVFIHQRVCETTGYRLDNQPLASRFGTRASVLVAMSRPIQQVAQTPWPEQETDCSSQRLRIQYRTPTSALSLMQQPFISPAWRAWEMMIRQWFTFGKNVWEVKLNAGTLIQALGRSLHDSSHWVLRTGTSRPQQTYKIKQNYTTNKV